MENFSIKSCPDRNTLLITEENVSHNRFRCASSFYSSIVVFI